MARARSEGTELFGPDGLLSRLTKRVLETALEEELTDHFGYEPHDPAGHHSGNSRNDTRGKTVLTEVGPVSVEVPRDRAGTFEPFGAADQARSVTPDFGHSHRERDRADAFLGRHAVEFRFSS